jgi:hypothetical protein
MFDSISAFLTSNIPSLDNHTSNLFPANVSALMSAYELVAPAPSILDFLQWFTSSTSDQVCILISSTQITLMVAVQVTAILQPNQFNSKNVTPSPSLQQVNSSIEYLTALVKANYPDANGYTTPLLAESTFTGSQFAQLTSSLLITDLQASNWTISLGSSIVQEVVTIDITSTAVNPLLGM